MGATKEQAEKTRESILESALKVFSEKGLPRARLEDIAADAGVTRGAIYWHFKDKIFLFSELYRKTLNVILGDARKILESESPPLVKIRTLLIELGVRFIEDRGYHAISHIMNYQYEWPSSVDEMINETIQKSAVLAQTKLLEVVEEGIKSGSLKDSVEPVTMAKTILTFMIGISTSSTAISNMPLLGKEELVRTVDLFLESIKN